MVNTNIVNRNWIFGTFNIFGDWSGDISFGGHSPDLRVQAAGAGTAAPDAEVAYNFNITNNGDVSASNVILNTTYNKDLLSFSSGTVGSAESATGTQWNIGDLAVGESREINAVMRVRIHSVPDGTSISAPLTARVSSSARDQNDIDNTHQTILNISGSSAVGLPAQAGVTGSGSSGSGGSSGLPAQAGGSTGSSSSGSGSSGGASSSGGGGGGSSSGGGGGSSASPSAVGNLAAGTGAADIANGSTSSTIGVPVVFVSATSTPGISKADPNVDPKITITKSAVLSASSTPSSIIIDYKVDVLNAKFAKPAYRTTLTDTLYDPWNKSMYTRSWKLDTLEPGDQVTLTYSVAFDAHKTKPGMYRNVARITGQRNETTYAPMVSKMPPAEGWGDVVFAEGKVLGALATAPILSTSVVTACVPLLSGFIRRGSANRDEVKKLQEFLNKELGLNLPVYGLFGPMTETAVRTFQQKYATEILAPVGLKRGTGSVYASTLKKINALACGGLPAPDVTVSTSTAAVPSTQSVPKKPAAKAKPKASSEVKTNPDLFNAIGGWFSRFAPKTGKK